MKAAILTIGDEILLGQILDTNSQFIAQQLTKLGAETIEMRSVADAQSEILQALADLFQQADVLIVTGGLGPTKDDITKQALADFFHTEVVFHPHVYAWLEEWFADHPDRLNAYNKTQAMLPKNCTALRNLKGTASGMWFEQDGKIIISLPGVPFEMEYLLEQEVLPRLQKRFPHLSLRYQVLTVYDIPEAQLAMQLDQFEKSLPAGIKLAYLPSAGFVRLRLTAVNAPEKELKDYFEKLQQELAALPFTVGEESTEVIYARQLQLLKKTIACAESCTGGNIARLITSVPGSSAYFMGGVVAYNNRVKEQGLGVAAEDLEKYGAVSEPVALQMAQGVRRVTGADFAVATTGVAGPGGGTVEKPVGTVWIAVAGPKGAKAKKFLFSRTRERNIGRASVSALGFLLQYMQETLL